MAARFRMTIDDRDVRIRLLHQRVSKSQPRSARADDQVIRFELHHEKFRDS
jgi:hypothetical protein